VSSEYGINKKKDFDSFNVYKSVLFKKFVGQDTQYLHLSLYIYIYTHTHTHMGGLKISLPRP